MCDEKCQADDQRFTVSVLPPFRGTPKPPVRCRGQQIRSHLAPTSENKIGRTPADLCAPGRIRTCDTRFRSVYLVVDQVIYQRICCHSWTSEGVGGSPVSAFRSHDGSLGIDVLDVQPG